MDKDARIAELEQEVACLKERCDLALKRCSGKDALSSLREPSRAYLSYAELRDCLLGPPPEMTLEDYGRTFEFTMADLFPVGKDSEETV